MKTQIEKLPKSTYKIRITVPYEKIKETREQLIKDSVSSTNIKGFRKGKAPKELVEKQLDENKIRGEVINRLLPKAYSQAIKEHHLNPIVQPKFTIQKYEVEQDLLIEAVVAERPPVKIGNYKSRLAELKTTQKKQAIYGPDGKLLKTKSDPFDNTQGHPLSAMSSRSNGERSRMDENSLKINGEDVLEVLLEISEVEIPDILIEREVNNMLSKLIDQTARLGLTVEQYLASTKKTLEQLREQYKKNAQQNLKAELVLSELIQKENIQATEDEIKETIKANPDEKTRKELEKEENRWYIKSIIQKQKIIDNLIKIAERGKV